MTTKPVRTVPVSPGPNNTRKHIRFIRLHRSHLHTNALTDARVLPGVWLRMLRAPAITQVPLREGDRHAPRTPVGAVCLVRQSIPWLEFPSSHTLAWFGEADRHPVLAGRPQPENESGTHAETREATTTP